MKRTGMWRLLGTRRGQATVEFGLIAPIFFFVFFGIINGGLLLYARNDIQHATDVGAAELATLGNACDTDQLAIQAMNQAGLGNTILTKVTEITIERDVASGGSSGETLTLDSSAEETYFPGSQNDGCTGVSTTSGWICSGTCTWPASSRQTNQTSGLAGNPDFAQLQVDYTFTVIGGFTTFHLTSTVTFRLEPQTL